SSACRAAFAEGFPFGETAKARLGTRRVEDVEARRSRRHARTSRGKGGPEECLQQTRKRESGAAVLRAARRQKGKDRPGRARRAFPIRAHACASRDTYRVNGDGHLAALAFA